MPIRDDSAGSYGTWSNDDLSWLDLLKAKVSDGGNALANLGRNLVDGFSPIGTSEQGNMALQVPPIVSGIAQSYGRLAGTPSHPGNAYDLTGVPELDAPIQQDMSNVLLSLYGGNAVSGLAKGGSRNALASPSARIEEALIPEAVEHGFGFASKGNVREAQSPYWPKSWNDNTEVSQWPPQLVERAKLFVREEEARAQFDPLVQQLMWPNPNGQQVMSRVDAERKLLAERPDLKPSADALYGAQRDFYEHRSPDWESDPYGLWNAPRYPGTNPVGEALDKMQAALQGGRDADNFKPRSDTGKPSILGSAMAGAADGGPNGPIGIRRTSEGKGWGVYHAFDGDKDVGFADYGVLDNAAVVRGVGVDPAYQRQGIASALHGRIQDDLGLPLTPDNTLSPESYAFWKASYPEALRDHIQNENGWWLDHVNRDMSNGAPDWRLSGGPNRPDGVLWSDNRPSPVGSALATAGENRSFGSSADLAGSPASAVTKPPIRAYHGTGEKFETFDPSATKEMGFHFGNKEQVTARRVAKDGLFGSLNPFSGWRTIPVDIHANNPAVISSDPGLFSGYQVSKQLMNDGIDPKSLNDAAMRLEARGKTAESNALVRDWMTDNGYDLLDYPNSYEGGGRSYMALGTGNVKHAKTGKTLYSSGAPLPQSQEDDLPPWLNF